MAGLDDVRKALETKKALDTILGNIKQGEEEAAEYIRNVVNGSKAAPTAPVATGNGIKGALVNGAKGLSNALESPISKAINYGAGLNGAYSNMSNLTANKQFATPSDIAKDIATAGTYGLGGVASALPIPGAGKIATGLNVGAGALQSMPRNYDKFKNNNDYLSDDWFKENIRTGHIKPEDYAAYQAKKKGLTMPKEAPVNMNADELYTEADQKATQQDLSDLQNFLNQNQRYIDSYGPTTQNTVAQPQQVQQVANIAPQVLNTLQAEDVAQTVPQSNMFAYSDEAPQTNTNIAQLAALLGADSRQQIADLGTTPLQSINNQSRSSYNNPYAQQMMDYYDKMTKQDYNALANEEVRRSNQANAIAALLGWNQPAAYNSTAKQLEAQQRNIANAMQFYDAMQASQQYGIPVTGGLASPDTMVQNIYGRPIKAQLDIEEKAREQQGQLIRDRNQAILNILRDTNKSELDKRRDIDRIDRTYNYQAQLLGARLNLDKYRIDTASQDRALDRQLTGEYRKQELQLKKQAEEAKENKQPSVSTRFMDDMKKYIDILLMGQKYSPQAEQAKQYIINTYGLDEDAFNEAADTVGRQQGLR